MGIDFERSNSPTSAGFDQLVRDVEAVIVRLEALAVAVPAGSRFRNYRDTARRLLACELAGTPLDIRTMHSAHQAIIEVSHLEHILATVETVPDPEPWVRKLRTVVADPPLSQEAKPDASARNIQFELLVAAMFAGGGFAVELAEPDALIRIQDQLCGVAAKRIRSGRKLRARIREGAEQVMRQQLDLGIVAIDVSQVLFPGGQYVVAADPPAATPVVKTKLLELLKTNGRMIETAAASDKTGIIAVLLSATTLFASGRDFATVGATHYMRFHPVLKTPSSSKTTALAAIYERFGLAQTRPTLSI